MRKIVFLLLITSVVFSSCDTIGEDDGPEIVDDCPIEVRESWLGDNPSGGYDRDYLYLEVENVGDSPILFKEGDMRVQITRPDTTSYTVTQNVCCELTREPYYQPGEQLTILDIPDPEIDERENVEDSEVEIVEQTTLDCAIRE